MKQFILSVASAFALGFVVSVAFDRSEPAPAAAAPAVEALAVEEDPFNLVREDLAAVMFMTNVEKAIWAAESSNGGLDGVKIYGEKGELGPLQITHLCWIDATEHDPTIGGQFRHCHDLGYALRICRSYLDRWALGKTEEEQLRIWHGGPDGHLEDYTLNYKALEYLK